MIVLKIVLGILAFVLALRVAISWLAGDCPGGTAREDAYWPTVALILSLWALSALW